VLVQPLSGAGSAAASHGMMHAEMCASSQCGSCSSMAVTLKQNITTHTQPHTYRLFIGVYFHTPFIAAYYTGNGYPFGNQSGFTFNANFDHTHIRAKLMQ
jgi:hypothetical protein